MQAKYELQYTEAMDIIGGLSTPSKMPWYSYSLSAYDCKTGSKLREVKNSTCSKCYACKGNYCFPTVRAAHARRLNAIDDPRFEDAFVLVLTKLYQRGRGTYIKDGVEIKENRFRWHDSGDIQTLEHLEIINRVALRTPFLDHWIPTREFGIVKKFFEKHGNFAPNLTVRMSAVMIGEELETSLPLPTSSVGVAEAAIQCKAYSQGGKCLDCRQCWDSDKDVNYPLH